jgi:hypothetical protein
MTLSNKMRYLVPAVLLIPIGLMACQGVKGMGKPAGLPPVGRRPVSDLGGKLFLTPTAAMCHHSAGAGPVLDLGGKRYVNCFPCRASGKVECSWCNGSGRIYQGNGRYKACSTCSGTGKRVCRNCGGKGVVWE